MQLTTALVTCTGNSHGPQTRLHWIKYSFEAQTKILIRPQKTLINAEIKQTKNNSILRKRHNQKKKRNTPDIRERRSHTQVKTLLQKTVKNTPIGLTHQ